MIYENALPERAETIAGVLDHGFELYIRSLKQAALLILLGAALGGVLSLIASRAGPLSWRNWWPVPLWLCVFLIGSAAQSAAIYSIGLRARGRFESFRTCMQFGIKDGLRMFGLLIVCFVLIALGFAAGGMWMYAVGASLFNFMEVFNNMPILGPLFGFFSLIVMFAPLLAILSFFSVPVMLAPCVLVLLRQGVFASIGTGFVLMGQHFWRSTLIFSVPGLLLMIAIMAVQSIVLVGITQGWGVSRPFILELVSQLVMIPTQALLFPLLFGSTIALFSDLLIRREGRDLAVQLDALT
jgi:hypothetical protein